MNKAPLMLTVSGLRGLIGASLTPDVAARYAASVGTWIKKSRGKANPHVVVGRDSRPSGVMIEQAAVAGLISVGCRVTILGIVSTPAVSVMVNHLAADGGLIITASHNPIVWNGIKTLRHDGTAASAEEAEQYIEAFRNGSPEYAKVEELQGLAVNTDGPQIHAQRILSLIDVAAIRARRFKVVLDSVHGAGGAETAYLLKELGVELVHLFAEPTGEFPHTPEPTRENLVGLTAAVKDHGADAGFAQDPDADRLAIVDEKGQYIGEEYTQVLAAMHLLGKQAGIVATNLSSSRMLDDVAERCGSSVCRTPVGEANVAGAMRKEKAVLGGEGNGGVIWPVICTVRDSLGGIALTLELLAKTGQKLSEVVHSIPSYAIVKDKLPIQEGMAERAMSQLKKEYASQKIDLQDGIRIDWPDQWIHVRASNTEPILRLIAEAGSAAQAEKLIHEMRAIIGA